MELIDGNAISETILEKIRAEIAATENCAPGVAFIRVGEDPASVFYVGKKQKVAARVGIRSYLHVLPDSVPADELHSLIDHLNNDAAVNGILIQAPLPPHLNETEVFNRVSPAKDVDGFNTVNIGKLCQDDPEGFVACTPLGIVTLLEAAGIPVSGKHVVVVGRSLIVGKPAALLFLRRGPLADATVTVCHSKTKDLGAVTRTADILIAAIGRPGLITADMVREGAVVIDVGINRVDDPARPSGYRLCGDVDFDGVAPRTAAITPVPGGVGPMTVAMLMHNTLKAWRQQRQHTAVAR